MKLRAIAAVAAIAMALSIAAPSATFAQANGSIDIFYVDPMTGIVDLGACQGAAIFAPPFTAIIQLDVWARLAGATDGPNGGISGIEGYIQLRGGGDLIDTTWNNWGFTPVTGTVADGSFVSPRDTNSDTVVDTRRGNFAWSGVTGPLPENGCQVGDAMKMVRLGAIQGSQQPVNNPIADNTWIEFVQGNPPSSVSFPCPLVTLCNAPIFTAVCVTGGSFLINPNAESCAVGVEKETWSGIKTLYR